MLQKKKEEEEEEEKKRKIGIKQSFLTFQVIIFPNLLVFLTFVHFEKYKIISYRSNMLYNEIKFDNTSKIGYVYVVVGLKFN